MNSNSLNYTDEHLTALLDCINRPFDYHPDGRVPDGNPNSTLQLIDYYDDNGVSTPILSTNNNPPDIVFDAVGVMYCYGQNLVRNITYDTYTCTQRNNALYGPIYFFIDNTGAILNMWGISGDGLATAQQAMFWSNDPVNMEQIVGLVNGTDSGVSLINAMRVLSAGVRFWPTIELVTDSTTVAISRYYGCQMTATSLFNNADQQKNMYTVMRNSPSYNEFPNSKGISGRFQPCQQGSILNPLNLNTIENIFDDNLLTNGMYFPVLLARLTIDQSVTSNDNTNLTFPVRSYFRTILEGSLNQPTPLQSTRVPFLPEWEDKVKHFSYRNDLYPSIVSGHSFKMVERAVVKLLGKNSETAKILQDTRKAIAQVKQAYNSSKAVVKQVSKAAKKKKKKQKLVYRKKDVLGNAQSQYEQVQAHTNAEQAEANKPQNILASALSS